MDIHEPSSAAGMAAAIPTPSSGDPLHKPLVALFVPASSFNLTQGKVLALAKVLAPLADVMTVCWDDDVASACTSYQIPFLRLQFSSLPFDVMKEGPLLVAQLQQHIINSPWAPSWGELLGFDDFIGTAAATDIKGFELTRPAAIVLPCGGGEASSVEDEQTRLALSRFARANHIPVLGLEVQRLDSPYAISQWPVDFLLTKRTYPSSVLQPLAPTVFPLPAAYRYLLSLGKDPTMETFLEQEAQLRVQLGWQPGTAYILLPFHLYYIQEFASCLQTLSAHAEVFSQEGIELLIHCGRSFRRELYEKDILTRGLVRWLRKFPKFHLLEGGGLEQWLLLSEIVVMPRRLSQIDDACARWGIPVWLPEEFSHFAHWTVNVRPSEALAWLLEKQSIDGHQHDA